MRREYEPPTNPFPDTKWEWEDVGLPHTLKYNCPFCGHNRTVMLPPNFCENCGKDMRGKLKKGGKKK